MKIGKMENKKNKMKIGKVDGRRGQVERWEKLNSEGKRAFLGYYSSSVVTNEEFRPKTWRKSVKYLSFEKSNWKGRKKCPYFTKSCNNNNYDMILMINGTGGK